MYFNLRIALAIKIKKSYKWNYPDFGLATLHELDCSC